MNPFEEIEERLSSRYKFLGITLKTDNEKPKKLSKRVLEKLQEVLVALSLANLIFHTTSEVVFCATNTSKENLVQSAACAMLLMGSSLSLAFWLSLRLYLGTTRSLMDACRHFHAPQHDFLRLVYMKHSRRALHYSNLVISILTLLSAFTWVALIVGGTLVSFMIENTPYPVPLMSVFTIDGTRVHMLVVAHMTWATATAIVSLSLYPINYFVIFTYVNFHFDALLEIIERFDEFSSKEDYEMWKRFVTDLLTLTKRMLSQCDVSARLPMVFISKEAYAIFLTSWVIWHFDKKLLNNSVGCFTLPIVLFAWVAVNERFKQKFSEVQEALYNLPWYEFPLAYRRDFAFILQSSQNCVLLSEGGFKELTFDWFTDIIKQGYKAGVLIQNMLT